MNHRIHHAFDQELVDLGVLTDEVELHALAAVAREIADDERHSAEDFADRHQADTHDAFAKVAKLPLDSGAVLLQRAPLLERHMRLDALERVFEPGARDDHVADETHQVVEPRQIDADEVGRAGRSYFARTLDHGQAVPRTLARCGLSGGLRWDVSIERLVIEPVVAPRASCRSSSVSTSNSNATPPTGEHTLERRSGPVRSRGAGLRTVSTFTPRATSSADGTNVTFHRAALWTSARGLSSGRVFTRLCDACLAVVRKCLEALDDVFDRRHRLGAAMSGEDRLEHPGGVDQRLEVRCGQDGVAVPNRAQATLHVMREELRLAQLDHRRDALEGMATPEELLERRREAIRIQAQPRASAGSAGPRRCARRLRRSSRP